MILRLKNLIFFKIVCLTLVGIGVFYALTLSIDDLTNSEYTMEKANQLVVESRLRLDAIKNKSGKIMDVLGSYSNLRKFENLDINDDSFNKDIYSSKINGAGKKYKLLGSPQISSSKPFVIRGEIGSNVTLSTMRVQIEAKLASVDAALEFASNAFQALPQYNLLRACEIKLIRTITPKVIDGISNFDVSNIANLSLNMEVKGLNLND
ncbi:MAG: hypothetical protein EB127_06520 [Alphaproteobacteria bacterium]|nr:hypothetical protein [Alphaproteobacteria bacterium]